MSRAFIIRKKVDRDFTIIPNSLLRDARLSWKALGLLVHMLHYPENYRLYLSVLTRQERAGRDGTRSAMRELENLFYLVKCERGRNKHGRFQTGTVWVVTDTPEIENFPPSENPKVDIPQSKNPTLISTNTEQELVIPITTTTPNAATIKVDGCMYVFPKGPLDEKYEIQKIIDSCGLEEEIIQDLLDEVEGNRLAGSIKKGVLPLLNALIKKSKSGDFKLSLGVAVKLKRQRNMEEMRQAKNSQDAVDQAKTFTDYETAKQTIKEARGILNNARKNKS